MATKTTSITVTGVVERADLKSRKPYDPYVGRYDALPTERDDYYLDIAIRLADGSRVFFHTTTARRTVSCAIGTAVVVYNVTELAAQWMEETKGNSIARPGEPNTNGLKALINIGDTITVTGRVKKTTPTYKVLNYTRRED